jgi:hypothetical protein
MLLVAGVAPLLATFIISYHFMSSANPDFSPKALKKAVSCGISFLLRKRCATNRRQPHEDRL